MSHDDKHHHENLPFYLRKPAVGDYITGFLMSVALTALPFWIVASGGMTRGAAMVLITAFAIAQMVVHLRFFLHYSTKRVPVEATVALALAIVVGAIIIAGAIWVMYDLNLRMMG